MQKKVRISQCMIVKNEEKNIRRALSWGKEILWEQIVVDTGSTDRTVEIAKEMGAKVYYFDWIGDFSAAKNYAIEQARGDWIAFLDADEYLNKEDTRKLYQLLEKLDGQPQIRRRCVIQSGLLELDDDGKVFSTTVQQRVFANTPDIRYVNKIHEKLQYLGKGQLVGVDVRKEISVYHTGYSASAYKETKKLERNVEMLQAAVRENPEDGESWSYLGDSLYGIGRLREAEEAFEKALSPALASVLSQERRELSYFGLVRSAALKDPQNVEVEERLGLIYENAVAEGIRFPDLDYWLGEWMYTHNRKEKAVHYLEKALGELEQYQGASSLIMTGDLETVYGILSYCHMELGDKQSSVRYGVLALRLNKYLDSALEAVLGLLRDEPGQGEDASATRGFLEKLYDFTGLRDRLYVMKAAKKIGFRSLYDLLYSQMGEEERAWLDARKQSPYRPDPARMKEAYPQLPCKNETDAAFITLIEEVKQNTEEALFEGLKDRMAVFRKKQPGDYEALARFLQKYPFWGAFDPAVGKYEALEGRVRSLKAHADDLVWLYGRLCDNRSRRALFAVLDNWLHVNIEGSAQTRETGRPYFDTDLIPDGQGDVFVDVGAYIGDSTQDYIKTYGDVYQKIYCYEITTESVENLKRNTRYYRDIEIRMKAAGKEAGRCQVESHEDMTANRAVKTDGENQEPNEVVIEMAALDEDIKEGVSFIKMDIEGMEQEALEGCAGHIQREHPRLAVSVYHGYEDIWRIPRLIDSLYPDYHFYLRNYGGDLIPAEYILYAV